MGSQEEMIEIRKYSNRRLYDTSASQYVTLQDVAKMIREGREIRVTDAKTGEDLTRVVMLQIICESKSEQEALPIGFLRQVIQASSNTVRTSIKDFLSLSLAAQKEAHQQVSHWMRLGMMTNPITAPFMAAWTALSKGAKEGNGRTPTPSASQIVPISTKAPMHVEQVAEASPSYGPIVDAEPIEKDTREAQIERLQAQLAAMQQQIESLREDKS